MSWARALGLVGLVGSAVAGCAGPAGTASSALGSPAATAPRTSAEQVFEGLAASYFEHSVFLPCRAAPAGDGTGWWIDAEAAPQFWQQYQRLVPSVDNPGYYPTPDRVVYTRFVGALLTGARFGHLGGYTGQVVVRRVLSMAPGSLAPAGCGPMGPAGGTASGP
jgi:hypothetical protein